MQDYSSAQPFHKTPRHSLGFFYILPLGLFFGFLLFVVSYFMKGGTADMLIAQTPSPTPLEESTLPTATPSPRPTVTPTPEGESMTADFRLRVLNGSGVAGTAGKMADELTSLGYETVTTGNADAYTYEDVTLRYAATKKEAAEALKEKLEKEHTVTIEEATDLPSTVDIEVVVGKEK